MSRTVTVPEWLNESFLQTVLQQDECRDREVKVKSFEVTPAVAAGANYVCDLFRVRGRYLTEADTEHLKDVSVIVKTSSTTDVLGKTFGDSPMKEYIAYKEFLPEVYEALKTERFTSKLLYSPNSNTLVLEDLKDHGFVMADRLKQLDFEHCLVCLKTLAKFHAAGAVIIKKNPKCIEELGKEIMYDRSNEAAYQRNKEMTNSGAYIFTKVVRNWSGFGEFAEKSCHVWETLLDELYNVFRPRKDFLNVLNHGDLWTTNVMFKYNSDGNIVDFRLLDFQSCRYATPAIDLIYFMFTSANIDVRENRIDELLTAYVETVNSVLEQLESEERLTLEQLNAELKRCQSFIFFVMVNILIVVLSDPDDLPNLDEVTEDNLFSAEGNPFEKCFQGKYYTEVAQQILHYLYKEGFFEQ